LTDIQENLVICSAKGFFIFTIYQNERTNKSGIRFREETVCNASGEGVSGKDLERHLYKSKSGKSERGVPDSTHNYNQHLVQPVNRRLAT